MIFCISQVSAVTSPFLSLILLIWALSLFFLMHLVKSLSVLFTYLKNQHLVSVTFAIVFFVSTSVTSALIFLSFLLLILGFVCSSFSSCKKGPRVTGQDERKKVKEEERHHTVLEFRWWTVSSSLICGFQDLHWSLFWRQGLLVLSFVCSLSWSTGCLQDDRWSLQTHIYKLF